VKIIHVLSGGLDSTVVLYKLLKLNHEVKCLSFNYGQRHKKELIMAGLTCKKLGIEHETIDLSCINSLLQGSSLTSNIEVPEGHYADSNMKNTVVPNRNMIMTSIAMGYAVSLDYDAISLGVHGGDHAIYPDCRPEFIKALRNISRVANYKPIKIITPFLLVDKKEVVRQGLELGVDFNLTWTCYKGLAEPCGKCGSCVEREEAFRLNG
jgi:7-cyano-7-deazaguanine synthase